MKRQKERLYRVIVAGATPEGIAATNKLGELGIPVTLVDSAPDLDHKLAAEEYRLASGLTFNHAHRPGLIRILRNSTIRTILPARISSIKHNAQGFSVHISKEPTYIDASRCVLCGKCAEICPVQIPGQGKAMRYAGRGSLPGRAIIDKRRQPLCQENCPLGVNVQGYMALVTQGKYEAALALIREHNVLPAICGRICTHPCEAACRRGQLDEPLSIRAIKGFLADYEAKSPERLQKIKKQLAEHKPAPKKEKIAVIGSGPSGLAAAADLARLGYDVTVLEKGNELGGLLRYGIGLHRLPKDVLDREISLIEAMGVRFVTNHPVDLAKDMEELLHNYQGVIVAVGSHKDRSLNVKGEDLDGVEGCLSFLARRHYGNLTSLPERVAVIGDGNSAFDLARILVRMDAEVSLISWFPTDQIPAEADEVRGAVEEGVRIIDATTIRSFQGKNGKLRALECLPTQAGPEEGGKDFRGIAWPIACQDAKPVILPFDRAFVAIGQVGAYTSENTSSLIKTSDRGFILADSEGRCRQTGIYATGDAVSGPSSVVKAMAAGRRTARALHADLEKKSARPAVSRPADRDFLSLPTAQTDDPSARRLAVAERDPQLRRQDFAEVALGITDRQALQEASRCLQCGVCSECQQCVEACGDRQAIDHLQQETDLLEQCGVLIVADPSLLPEIKGDDVLRAYGPKAARCDVNDMIVRGFDAAARAMVMLSGPARRPKGDGMAVSSPDAGLPSGIRIGVFVCRCKDSLGWLPGMDQHLEHLRQQDDIIHVETLESACVPEGASGIIRVVREKALTRIVLASCVCCPLNFVCSSCTDQRSRLKESLFHGTGISRAMVETCNLRGEILRLVQSDPDLALHRFQGLLHRSIKRTLTLQPIHAAARNYNFAAAVIGNSQATITSAMTLAESDHEVLRLGTARQPLTKLAEHKNIHNFPNWHVTGISGTIGDFRLLVESEGQQQILRAGTVILGEKARRRIAYTYQKGLPSIIITPLVQESGCLGIPFAYPCATSVPGLFLAEPPDINVSKLKKGEAAAMMAAAAMPRGPRQAKGSIACVDAKLCRGCGRCAEACLYHAITLRGNEIGGWYAYVDAALCKGCGNCISVCPTSAADSPYRSRAYLEKAIAELLK